MKKKKQDPPRVAEKNPEPIQGLGVHNRDGKDTVQDATEDLEAEDEGEEGKADDENSGGQSSKDEPPPPASSGAGSGGQNISSQGNQSAQETQSCRRRDTQPIEDSRRCYQVLAPST
jgi:hypothetical protein